MKKLQFVLFLFIVSLTGIGCQQDAAPDRPVIVTSISVYQDLIMNVTGSAAEVRSLVSGMENPHTLDFSGSKVRLIRNARLIVFNGMGLEGWIDQVKQSSDPATTTFLTIADSLTGSPLLRHGDNPHLWMDPRIAAEAMKVILPALTQLLPDSAERFRQRAEEYVHQLDSLFRDVGYKLQPLAGKKVITQTPGLDYFFSAFGIERTASIVMHPGTEPSAKRMTSLIEQSKSPDAIAIIRLPQFSKKLPETLQAESGLPLVEMSPLITGAPNVETYIDLIWYNTDQISAATLPRL